MNNKCRGSITVFFSLLFILILAMLGTIAEGVRFKICEVHAYRTLRMAAESLFTEYSRPLFDDYRLFFIEDAGEPFEVSVAGYAAGTLRSGKETATADFFGGNLEEVEVDEVQYAGDFQAQALELEISEYMGRRLAKSAFKKFAEKQSEIGTLEETGENLEKRMESEREAAKLDQSLLKLMKLLDGVSLDSSGKVKGEKYFMKMFCLKDEKSEDFAIGNQVVWEEVKKNLFPVQSAVSNLDQYRSRFQKTAKQCIIILDQAIKEANFMKEQYQEIDWGDGRKDSYFENMGRFMDGQLLSILKGNKRVLENTITVLKNVGQEEAEERLTSLWKSYNCKGISFDYSGLSGKSGMGNPSNGLKKEMKRGLLNLVVKEPEHISDRRAVKADQYSNYYKEKDLSADYEKKIGKFIQKDEVKTKGLFETKGAQIWQLFCLDRYIGDFFDSAAQGNKDNDNVLKYETEYIIAGKESDIANLNSIVNHILLIRTVANFSALWADSNKKSIAYAAAAAIVGFTCMESLIRLTQSLLMVAWAMAEGLVDIAALLQGKAVPMVKKSSQFRLDFPDLFTICHDTIQREAEKIKKGKLNMDYKDYLNVLLLQKKKTLKLYRIMDLIQWNIRKKYNCGFQFQNMAYSVQVRGSFRFQTRFFRFPAIESIVGRKLQEFYMIPVTRCTY